jgi:uncharacterized protein
MRSLAALAVAVVALLGGAAQAGTDSSTSQHAIIATGTGSVSAVPDRAHVSFAVSTDAKSASAALRGNAAEMTKVIAAIKAQGIPAADVRTEAVSLSPRTSANGEAVVGFTALNSVSVTLRVLGKVGAVIDAAVEAGANQVSGPDLVRSEASALYRQALRAAVADARAKALTLARASGLRLRRITDVSEASAAPPPQPQAAKTDASASTPIEPGTQLVEATVTVTFAVA